MGGLTRLVRRYRRPIAFVLAFTGVLLGLASLREEPPRWQGLVASRDLRAGHTLTSGDVRLEDLSTSAEPSNALTDPDAVNGRVLAGSMVAGEMLLDSRLVGPGLLDSGPAGNVAVPIRLEDPAEASFLAPGDKVDVLAARRVSELGLPDESTPQPAEVVARGVTVLAIPAASSPGGGGLLGADPGSVTAGSVLVVSVTKDEAVQIAGAAANARLSVALRGM